MEAASVYIDESRNSSSHADRPAFGVIAGLIVPQSSVDGLGTAINLELTRHENEAANEAKWHGHRTSYANERLDCLNRASTILSTIFEEAARDPDIEIFVSSLNGPAYKRQAQGNEGLFYNQLMTQHYLFYMHSTSYRLAGNGMTPDLRFNFDQFTTCEDGLRQLNESCRHVSQVLQKIGEKKQQQQPCQPDVRFDFCDSAHNNLIQFSDLMAGATCAGLDNNVRLTEARLSLLQRMACGIADMHDRQRPEIQTIQHWQDFIRHYQNNPRGRFTLATPHLDVTQSPARNAANYMRQLRLGSGAAA